MELTWVLKVRLCSIKSMELPGVILFFFREKRLKKMRRGRAGGVVLLLEHLSHVLGSVPSASLAGCGGTLTESDTQKVDQKDQSSCLS